MLAGFFNSPHLGQLIRQVVMVKVKQMWEFARYMAGRFGISAAASARIGRR